MTPLFGKSKEEKEIEREIRYRKARSTLQRYIDRLEKLQKMVFEQGKTATKLGEDKFVTRQAAKYLAIQDRIRRGQKMLLLMEEARVQREMVKVSGDFITFANDISQSIAEGPNVEKVAQMQTGMEKAMARAESLDEALSVAMDMASEGIMTSQDFSEKNVDEIVKSMQGEVESEEKGLDERISKGIKGVEDAMRKG
jgi:hypothetical protein